jgi:hypothetical protein
MISLWRIFWLELTALVRSKTLPMLLVAAIAYLLAFPHLVVFDGTPEGRHELLVRYGLGGVFALVTVSLLASATGAIASERAAKRLQLTQVRPVSGAAIAWGKFLAHAAAGAIVLAAACALTVRTADFGRRCNHVYGPVLESPEEEAAKMYDVYMTDPETPPEIKNAKKSVILRLLAQRARDHYQSVGTNEVATWQIRLPGGVAPERAAVRFRFSNDFSMRQDVLGTVTFGEFGGAVSNFTQAVIEVPLAKVAAGPAGAELVFQNQGSASLMLRPRQDVALLVPADSGLANLFRAYLRLVFVLAAVIAVGVFLGAGLSRPVALFSAIVLLAVSEMSPSVIQQYPDQLEADRIDRVGLAVTRAVGSVTRPVSALSPLDTLAAGDCVEPESVGSSFLVHFLLLPLVLSLASGLVMSRKTSD